MERQRVWRLFILTAVSSVLVLATRPGEAKKESKTVEGLEQLFPQAEQCSACHRRAFTEWQESFHARALVASLGPLKKYLTEIQHGKGRLPSKEEYMVCGGCHTPTLRFAAEEVVQDVVRSVLEDKQEGLARFSVSCSFCHTTAVSNKLEKDLYYGPIQAPASVPGVHESRYAPVMATAEFCQPCHELYKSPAATVYCSLVYESWKESPVSKEKQCQDCHMKASERVAAEVTGAPVRTVHSHLFPGGNTPAALQEAVEMDLAGNRKDSTLVIDVEVKNLTGHRIPDG